MTLTTQIKTLPDGTLILPLTTQLGLTAGQAVTVTATTTGVTVTPVTPLDPSPAFSAALPTVLHDYQAALLSLKKGDQ
ncbi:hypothetical protein [Levilactobacillus suantsaii]|uniref:hypothetical protein n=1 Tax=Levilactobacillus suantsaii TaxID=2292255 RepID=UPI00100A8B2C|nr:hypothetical protein [Levilactobacillus suantsaii]QMU08420.1 hypothetical protein H3M12_01715 [Levilactobacillus suantsaii]